MGRQHHNLLHLAPYALIRQLLTLRYHDTAIAIAIAITITLARNSFELIFEEFIAMSTNASGYQPIATNLRRRDANARRSDGVAESAR